MKPVICISLAVPLLFSLTAFGASYSGNGNSGFGGPIGQGSLNLTDNGTTVFGTLNKGPNNFNDVLVIYINSVSGGFTDTSGFADANDGLRRAISGFDGGANRSVLTMPGGFSADYAIALGPSSDSFGGLWQLANGGGGSLNFVASVSLTPVGTATSPTYSFSFDLSQIGLTPAPGSTFSLLGTLVSTSGYRSDEALPGNLTGTPGWNPFSGTASGSYTVPEPSALGLLGLSALALVARRRMK
jgi:hypothetical protein